MNELILVTDTLLYRPGDYVTGHVWLNICTPTAGRSLHISLRGTETCEKLSRVYSGRQTEVYTQELIPNCDAILWQAHDTFPFGSYRAPFELQLPQKLPGSFSSETLDDWVLGIDYTVHAYVVEDEDLRDYDSIVVSQQSPIGNTGSSSPTKTCQKFEVKQFLGLTKAHVVLECSLQKDFLDKDHTFASQLVFDVTIQNSFKTCRIVKRTLKLIQVMSLCGQCVFTESVMQFVTGNCYQGEFGKPLDQTDLNSNAVQCEGGSNTVKREHNSNTVQCDGNSKAVKSSSEWQRVILSEEICDKPCCSVIFDLSKCDAKHKLEGSTYGTTIKCQYQVMLSITLDDGEVLSAQPCDIWIHSHSDMQHMPSNTHKLTSVKQNPIFVDAVPVTEHDR
ncbi:uncharacterized protein [Watersipora subatra]|uniref:uncharacterized protein n=1 Tax=Watersipora subatra TaxID=2589382 RepID=UPI00355AF675